MFKSSKKIFSFVLSLIILATVIMPILRCLCVEPDENSLKNDLISAWTEISKESKQTTEIIARPKDGLNGSSRVIVTADTVASGLTDTSVLGDVYYDKMPISGLGWGKVYNYEFDPNAKSLNEYTSVSLYMCGYDSSYNATTLKIATQVNNGNTKYTEFKGWKNVTVAKASGGFKFVIESGSSLAYLSMGCILGQKTVSGPELPENSDDIPLLILVNKALGVDVTGFKSEEKFNNALMAAKNYISSDEQQAAMQKLVSAWQILSEETKELNDIVARPKNGINGTNRVDISADTEVSGLSDVSVLGDTYYDKLPITGLGWSKQYYFEKDLNALNLSQYDSLSLYMCGYNSSENSTKIKVVTQVNNTNDKYTEFNGWKNVTVAKVDGAVKFVVESGSELATLSVGCITGKRTVKAPALPKNYASMSLVQLITYVKTTDYEGFNSTESFKTALQEAEEAAGAELAGADLISAWTKLSKEKVTVQDVLAYPMPNIRKIATESIKETYSLSDDDYSALGGFYAYVDFETISKGEVYFRNEKGLDGINMAGYDSVTVFVKTFDDDGKPKNGSLSFQINGGADGKTGYPWPNQMNYRYSVSNSTFEDYYKGIKSTNNFKFQKNNNSTKYALVGTFIGKKTLQGAPLPENSASLSLAELVNEAANVDYKPFNSGEEFKNALMKAKTALKGDKNALKYMLVSVWKDLAEENKQVIENIAYTEPTIRKTATQSIIEKYGLSEEDYADLGGVYSYVDITAVTNGDLFFRDINGKDNDLKLSNYEKISVFVKIFDKDEKPVDGCLSFQINEGQDGSQTAYPWPKSSGWRYTVQYDNSRYKDYFSGAKTANNMKFQKNSNSKYVLVGAFRGYRTVKAEGLPENYEDMTLDELVSLALTVEYSGFENADKFKSALRDAREALDISEVYKDELLEEMKKLDVDLPNNTDKLSLVDLVYITEKINIEPQDAPDFAEKLLNAQTLISDRKNKVIEELSNIGESLLDSVKELSADEFANEILNLDLSQNKNYLTEFKNSFEQFYILTSAGQVSQQFLSVYKKITDLPENYQILTIDDLIALSENTDDSGLSDVILNSKKSAYEGLKDQLTKGKAKTDKLEKLIKDGSQIDLRDFSNDTSISFEKSLRNSNSVLEFKKIFTQNDIDTVKAELLDAWGKLKVYNRTLWVDFLEYYTGENPEAHHNTERADFSHSGAKITALHNGVNTGLKVTEQPSGWHPVNHYGIELENLKEYSFIEAYFKASPETFKGNALTFQLQSASGVEWYNYTFPLSSDLITGNWEKIELQLDKFSKVKNETPDTMKLTEDVGFRAYRIRVMNEGEGNNTYELSSLVVVSLKPVEAGIVPEIPKLVVKDRSEEISKIPHNPFTGIDRKDPWGDEERKNSTAEKGDNQIVSDDLPIKTETAKKTSFDNKGDKNIDSGNFFEDDDILDVISDNLIEDDTVIGEGTCGENLTWTLTNAGKLTVSGKGDMFDFENETPWEKLLLKIKKVFIDNGVTSIGDGAFYGCKNLSEVNIADSVTKIGGYTFYECNALSELLISNNVTEIGDAAFGYVYDKENNSLAKASPFTVFVAGGSKAHEYAKKNGINYSLISGKESDLKEKTASAKNKTDDSFNYIVLISVVVGGFVIVAGVFLLVLKMRKSKKNRER